MFEDPENRQKIKEIFENLSYQEKRLVPMFKKTLEDGGPIGLYVATKDQKDITWLFDEKEIALMLGGEDALISVTSQLLPTKEDKEDGVLFVIFKKVGPIYSIRIERAVLEEVFC
jgi:hypothetical protein